MTTNETCNFCGRNLGARKCDIEAIADRQKRRIAELECERDALATALKNVDSAFGAYHHDDTDSGGTYDYLLQAVVDSRLKGKRRAILDAHDAALTERVQRETLEQCEIMCCGTCGGTGHEERGWQGNVECSACDGSGAVVALRTIKREFSKEGK